MKVNFNLGAVNITSSKKSVERVSNVEWREGVKHITTPFITIRAIKAYTRFSLSRSPSHPMAIRDTADMIPRSEMSHDA